MKKKMTRCLVFAVASMAYSAFATVVEWEFPRLDSCHEGLPFSDGRTGVLVWGGGDTINMTVGRADLWDHRGGYPWLATQSYTNIVELVRADRRQDLFSLFKKVTPPGEPRNPLMLPLGRVLVKVPGKTLKCGTLDTKTGIGQLTFSDGTSAEIVMPKANRVLAINFGEKCPVEVTCMPATDHEKFYQKHMAPLSFKKAVKRADGFDWELPADKSVSLDCIVRNGILVLATNRGGRDYRAQKVAEKMTFATLRDASANQWKAFWAKGARVRVPDAEIQEIFDYGMYRFGAMTDPDGVPAGLQGPWLEDNSFVPWNGDYHFNINVQECYSPAYRGGHFEHLMPLFKMILSWRALLRENARQFVGIQDGYVLPHSVDDRGVCIGGFWTGTIDHASTMWVASLMMRYVRYSGDVAFLKSDAYDFMCGAMNVSCAMITEDASGNLSLPLGPSPEWGGMDVQAAVGRNSSFQLAAIHRLVKDLMDAEKLLGKPVDPRWVKIAERLPKYSADELTGICLFENRPFTETHRHHSHLAGLYPFDIIPTATEADRKVLQKSYDHWVHMGMGFWSGWCVPWASILHTHMGSAEASVFTLRMWKTFFNNPGHGSLHDAFHPGVSMMMGRPRIMQMDGQCAAVTAVMEMMAHETNGKLEFFKGCPATWKDVSFENLALSDGTRVNGRRLNGKIVIEKVKTP